MDCRPSPLERKKNHGAQRKVSLGLIASHLFFLSGFFFVKYKEREISRRHMAGEKESKSKSSHRGKKSHEDSQHKKKKNTSRQKKEGGSKKKAEESNPKPQIQWTPLIQQNGKKFTLSTPSWTPSTTPVLTVYIQFSDDKKSLPSRHQWKAWCEKMMEEEHLFPVLVQGQKALTSDQVFGPQAKLFLSCGPVVSTFVEQFPAFVDIPDGHRRLWIHRTSFAELQASDLFESWLLATEPVQFDVKVKPLTDTNPLVSFFIAAYRSGAKFERPLRSLLAQTHRNWECVIVDDSDDGGENLAKMKEYVQNDARFRFYPSYRRTGYIGNSKREAASLCRGSILVEMDHDDDFSSQMTAKIVEAFLRNPTAGFVATDCIEEFWPTGELFHYKLGYSYNHGAHARVWVPWQGRVQYQMICPPLNRRELNHLVGMPNHVRVWKREVYFGVGGHRGELKVSDDFDVLLRTYLSGVDWVRIPVPHYIQYKNPGGDNFTFHFNRSIQILCRHLWAHYRPALMSETDRRGGASWSAFDWMPLFCRMPENHPARKNLSLIDQDPQVESFIYVFSGFTHFELDGNAAQSSEQQVGSEALRTSALERTRDYLRRHRKLLEVRNGNAQVKLHEDLARFTQQQWRTPEGKSIQVTIVGTFDETQVLEAAKTAGFANVRWYNVLSEDAEAPMTISECLRYAYALAGRVTSADHIFGATPEEIAHSIEGNELTPGPEIAVVQPPLPVAVAEISETPFTEFDAVSTPSESGGATAWINAAKPVSLSEISSSTAADDEPDFST